MTKENFVVLYDSSCDNTKKIVLTENMLNRLKKHCTAIDFLDSKTGRISTLEIDSTFYAKEIIINF